MKDDDGTYQYYNLGTHESFAEMPQRRGLPKGGILADDMVSQPFSM